MQETTIVDELQELLEVQHDFSRAREICFRELTKAPENLVIRLLLAKSFYLDRLPEFCARELREILCYRSSEPITKLLDALQTFVPSNCSAYRMASSEAVSPGKTIAEVEFDSDFVDILAELEKETGSK